MCLWFRFAGRPYLGLFKMDPGTTNKVSLAHDTSGRILLELAVQHVEQSLPDSSDEVLKWAIVPHPTRLNYELKVRDHQARADPAKYFMEFLGCQARLSEKLQVDNLLLVLPSYAKECHPERNWEAAVEQVYTKLESEPAIDIDTVATTVQTLGELPNFDKAGFQDRLSRLQAEPLNITAPALKAAKVQYDLPSGIMIRGPRAIVESVVTIVDLGGEKEIRIRTPSYEKNYV